MHLISMKYNFSVLCSTKNQILKCKKFSAEIAVAIAFKAENKRWIDSSPVKLISDVEIVI